MSCRQAPWDGHLGCRDLSDTMSATGPVQRLGYVGLMTDENGDPEAPIVEGGCFHGGQALRPVSQIGKENVMNYSSSSEVGAWSRLHAALRTEPGRAIPTLGV